jgi:EAL domain-containing protein (putative c-di-GMP-specific phosphodiesterase class I)/ActR/RegA family two-component response regulator
VIHAKDVTFRLDATSLPGPSRAVLLVIDTDATQAEQLASELRTYGFEVDIEVDVAKARERLLFERFKAVLCSMDLKGGSGVDLLTLARCYDKHMPFMLLVDERSLDGVIEAVKLGPTQYVLKPVVTSRVVDTLKGALLRVELARNTKIKPQDSSDLSQALERAYVAFQPIVLQLPNGVRRTYAYESLLRSDHPGLSSPLDILAQAELSNRVRDVGRRARELAANCISSMQATDALVFVNLTATELNDEQLYDRTSALAKVASRVVLEITEREDVKTVKSLEQRLLDLRIMGFRVAIDDLGAGYAGLSSFVTLEPDYVKLDMSLVRGVHDSVLRQRIIKSVLNLSSDLSIQVIAEGVEVEEEFACLQALGIRYYQGYFLGKPERR